MMDRLNALAEKFDVIAQVRGRGAMVAIEFAEPGTLKPLPDLPKALAARCTQEGVVILTAGTFGNVIRLLPPLVISDELLIEGLDVLADALAAELPREPGEALLGGGQTRTSPAVHEVRSPFDGHMVDRHALPTPEDVDEAVPPPSMFSPRRWPQQRPSVRTP